MTTEKNRPSLEVFSDLLEFKSEDGKYYFKGYLSTPDIDLVNDLVTQECMKDMLSQINSGISGYMRGIKGSDDHDVYWTGDSHRVPVSKITNATLDNKGVLIEGIFNSDHPNFKSIWNQVQNGFYDGLSIEYRPVDFAFKDVDGKKVRVLNKITLKGYGHTPRPANPYAKLTDSFVKSLEMDDEVKKEITDEKIDFFMEDEDKASKEYASYGFFDLSNDERRHYMFFKSMKENRLLAKSGIEEKKQEETKTEEIKMEEIKPEVKAETQPAPQIEVKTEEKVEVKAEEEKKKDEKDSEEEDEKEEEKCNKLKKEEMKSLIEEIKAIIKDEMKTYANTNKALSETPTEKFEVKAQPTDLVGHIVKGLGG